MRLPLTLLPRKSLWPWYWHNQCLICEELLGQQVTCRLYGYNFITNWTPVSTSQGHMIIILIQPVFFCVRSSELSGARPAVPTSCGNRPTDRYAVIYDYKGSHVFCTVRELTYAWKHVWCGFVYERCWHVSESWQAAAPRPWTVD